MKLLNKFSIKDFNSNYRTYKKALSISNRMPELLVIAAYTSLPIDKQDTRNFWLGAVGLRKDGTIVSSKNGSVFTTITEDYQLIPSSHAEGRCLRKLGQNGILYVGRALKKDCSLALAKPCCMCQTLCYSHNVKKVYYTISSTQYGVWIPKTNENKVINI